MLDLNAGQWSIIIRVSSLGLFLLGIPWRPYAVEDGDERGQEYGRTPISRHPQNPFSIRLLLDRESGRRSLLDQSGEYASALRSPGLHDCEQPRHVRPVGLRHPRRGARCGSWWRDLRPSSGQGGGG
jgi:hypothetical protein